jgi:glucosamine-6-phosphate deaminase
VVVEVLPDKGALGRAAAQRAATILREAIAARGQARIVVATGASQFEFLAALAGAPGVAWKQVELFHLDEYLGLPITHPASFRRYLRERLIDRVGIERAHLLDGEGDVPSMLDAVSQAIAAQPIDVAFVGIGENGHLAFNDPPADFTTEAAYLIVELDEACRRQQVGEGWFARLEDVPTRAISMSVRQILRAREILCIVPDRRKADAVRDTLTGPVTPRVPASVLRQHARATLYLDPDSAALLPPQGGGARGAAQAAQG